MFHVSYVSKIADDPIGLLKWYGKHGTEYCEAFRDKKAERGRTFHSLLEETLKKKNVALKEYVGPIQACLSLLDIKGYTYINSEVTAESKKLNLVGTYDCQVKNIIPPTMFKNILIDWKLTSGLRVSNYVQGGGYNLLHPGVFDGFMVIRPYFLERGPKHDSIVTSVSGSTRYKWKEQQWALETRYFDNGQLKYLTEQFKKCLDIAKFREEMK